MRSISSEEVVLVSGGGLVGDIIIGIGINALYDIAKNYVVRFYATTEGSEQKPPTMTPQQIEQMLVISNQA